MSSGKIVLAFLHERDPKVLKFMQLEPTSILHEAMDQSLYFRSLSERDQQERILNTWFHALAVGVLHATFEICEIVSPLSFFPVSPSLQDT